RLRSPADTFIYEYVIVPSAEDAVAAILTNPNILACVVRPGFSTDTKQRLSRDLRETIALARDAASGSASASPRSQLAAVQRVLGLADTLNSLRPELDLYLIAGAHIEDLAGA